MLQIILLVVFTLYLVLFYIFISKRLNVLQHRHFEQTWIDDIKSWIRLLRRRIVPLFIILYVLGVLLIVTIFNNGLLY